MLEDRALVLLSHVSWLSLLVSDPPAGPEILLGGLSPTPTTPDPGIHRSHGAVWWRPRTPGSPGAPVWYVEHSAHSVARLATCACVCIQYICSLSSSVVSGCRHLGMSRHLVDPDFGGISGNASLRMHRWLLRCASVCVHAVHPLSPAGLGTHMHTMGQPVALGALPRMLLVS